MGDLIDRQAAIDEILGQPPEPHYPSWYAKQIKQLPPAQRWIPVTERLPEYGKEVITVNKDGEFEINHVIDEENGEWFFDGVVAWMPLPKWEGDAE